MVAFAFVCIDIAFAQRVSMGFPSTVGGPVVLRTSQVILMHRRVRADEA
jgi:hypothetical protein